MSNRFQVLSNNDGMTLLNNKEVRYKTGYQVATHGVKCKTAEEAEEAVKAFNGNAGVWHSEGIFYVDHSIHIRTKKQACRIAKACHQLSILEWKTMGLIWMKKGE